MKKKGAITEDPNYLKNQMCQNMRHQSVTNQVKDPRPILTNRWFCPKENVNFTHHTLSNKCLLGLKSNRFFPLPRR